MLGIEDFRTAAARLSGVAHETPLVTSRTFSEMSGADVYLKCENLQRTGSFKVRGAYNKIMKRHEEGGLKAVVASSAGNHAQGVAFAASRVGVPSTIVMPKSAPVAKVSATRGYGAEVILHGDVYDEAYAKACQVVEERGAEFIHPFDDEDVIAGQGTIALEIISALPFVDTVLVPAGGGGMLAGIATCAKQVNPRIEVIGVQAAGAPAIADSFAAKGLVPSQSVRTIADGIAVKTPGSLTMEYINHYVDQMVTVTDTQIADAILLLFERCKLVVEPAGATSLAAVLNKCVDLAGKSVCCVLSGGNIDVSLIHKVVAKGLVARERHVRLSVVVPDTPGSLEKLLHVLASENVNVVSLEHDRFHTGLALGETLVHVMCEVSDRAHTERALAALEERGYAVTM